MNRDGERVERRMLGDDDVTVRLKRVFDGGASSRTRLDDHPPGLSCGARLNGLPQNPIELRMVLSEGGPVGEQQAYYEREEQGETGRHTDHGRRQSKGRATTDVVRKLALSNLLTITYEDQSRGGKSHATL